MSCSCLLQPLCGESMFSSSTLSLGRSSSPIPDTSQPEARDSDCTLPPGGGNWNWRLLPTDSVPESELVTRGVLDTIPSSSAPCVVCSLSPPEVASSPSPSSRIVLICARAGRLSSSVKTSNRQVHMQYRHSIPAPVGQTSASAWLYEPPWITYQKQAKHINDPRSLRMNQSYVQL